MIGMAVAPSSRLTPELLSAVTASPSPETMPTPELLRELAQRLDAQGIPYCQWKGHWSAHRWKTGLGDVDLLIDRGALADCRRLMSDLGFKLALPSGARQIPGVECYVGHDPGVPRLLQVRVYYRLMMGDYWKPVFRIPIEDAVVRSALPGGLFHVPAPTQQYLIFLLRVMLRQVGRPLLSLQKRWRSGIQPPLSSLAAAADDQELAAFLRQHLPSIDFPLFQRCVRALQGQSSAVQCAVLPWLLARKLRAHARAPSLAAVASAAIEAVLPEELAARLVQRRMRFSGGGTVVGLVGGRGAGKSTCAREIAHWLRPVIPTMRANLGDPPRSLLTWITHGLLWAEQTVAEAFNRQPSPTGVLSLLRYVCVARDRYRLNLKAHRFAAGGGVAVCDHSPIREARNLMEPRIRALLPAEPGRVAVAMRDIENAYYRRMVRPDVLCVLELAPDPAVRRNPDQPGEEVREERRVSGQTDWSSAGAHVIDASLPFTEVLRQMKSLLWRAL
jgi:hypothetical protein